MEDRQRRFGIIAVFVLLQLAWVGLLGLWISWYTDSRISNDSARLLSRISPNILTLSGGIALLAGVSVGIALQFAKLMRQVQLNRMYDSFMANVSHELKTPLASMQLHLETLTQSEMSGRRRAHLYALMSSDSKRLNEQIDSILEIARLENRRSLVTLERVDADRLVRSIVDESRVRHNSAIHSITFSGSSGALVEADRSSLKVAFDNLIDNAIKYSKQEPRISIEMSRVRRYVRVSCTDSGVGLAPHDRKRVFRKFHRVDDPDSPSVRGVGLGLYRVREIVRLHRGRVSVVSVGRGAGATFRIDLPKAGR